MDTASISYRRNDPQKSELIGVELQQDFSGNKFFPTILKAKNIDPAMPKETFIRLKNIEARLEDGTSVAAGSWPFRFCFGGGCATATTIPSGIGNRIFPRPSPGNFWVEIPDAGIQKISVMNAAGQTVWQHDCEPNAGLINIQPLGLPGGWYLVEMVTNDGMVIREVQIITPAVMPK